MQAAHDDDDDIYNGDELIKKLECQKLFLISQIENFRFIVFKQRCFVFCFILFCFVFLFVCFFL